MKQSPFCSAIVAILERYKMASELSQGKIEETNIKGKNAFFTLPVVLLTLAHCFLCF